MVKLAGLPLNVRGNTWANSTGHTLVEVRFGFSHVKMSNVLIMCVFMHV